MSAAATNGIYVGKVKTKVPPSFEAEKAAIMGLCFPLSDILQMELGLVFKNGRYTLEGDRKFSLPVSESVSMELPCSVVASRINLNEVTMLLHVIGDLYVYCVSQKSGGEVSLAIVDASKHPNKAAVFERLFDSAKADETFLFPNAAKMMVATYRLKKSEKRWERMDVIDTVEQRPDTVS